jgi:hypothetical protein
MQQKYLRPRAVQGGVQQDVADLPCTQFLRLRGETEKCVDLAGDEQLPRLDLRVGDPADVLDRIDAHLGSHQHDGQQLMRGRPEALHPNALALQVADAADVVTGEQFETPDMDAGQQRERYAVIDRLDEVRGVIHLEFKLSSGGQLHRLGGRHVEIADVGKTLGAQQFLGGVFGDNTDRAGPPDADRSRLGRPLSGSRRRTAEEAEGSASRKGRQKFTAGR